MPGTGDANNMPLSTSADYRTVRLPQFIGQDPELWCCMVEATFTAAGITNSTTKFGFVINCLDPKHALELRDILILPPSDDNYTKLKKELIKRFSKSQEAKIRQILEREELGDRSPSQFMRHLKGLAGTQIPDSFIRTLWLDRLPNYTKAILSTQDDLELYKLAELADKINDVTSQRMATTPPICETVVQNNNSQIEQLRAEIAELRTALRDVTRPSRANHRSTSKHRYRSKSNSRNNEICWYHKKFQNNAHKCIAPCNFTTSSQGQVKQTPPADYTKNE